MKGFILMLYGFGLISLCRAVSPALRFGWKELDYAWSSPIARYNALKENRHVAGNQLLSGIGIWKNKFFMAVPRLLNGVVSTLNYIDLDAKDQAPLLNPYPSWQYGYFMESATELPSNSTVISACRIAIDACDRLWAIDTGTINYYGKKQQLAGPSIVIFDLNTNQLLHRYFLKPSDIRDTSYFTHIAIDVTRESCDDAFAYVADIEGFAAITFSLKANDSWRVTHPFFHMDPMSSHMNSNGVEFVVYDGLFGFTLSEPQKDGYRTAYFHPFVSTKEFSVPTEVLRTFPQIDIVQAYPLYQVLGDRGHDTQSTCSLYDPATGVLFYTLTLKNSIACWNTKKPYTVENNPVLMFNQSFEFINDMRMAEDGTIYFLVNKYARFLDTGLDSKEINYSIYTFNAKEAIAGTACE